MRSQTGSRAYSGGAFDGEAPRNGDGRDAFRAKLGAARAVPEVLARGCSSGSLYDEAPRERDGHDALRASLQHRVQRQTGSHVATAAALLTKRRAIAMAAMCVALILE